MDRDQARKEIREKWRDLIPRMTAPAQTRVNGETSWVCPLCGHGAHGDGLTRNPRSTDGNGLKCFGCGFAGDIIDLYQRISGAGHNAALMQLAQELGIAIDPYRPVEKGPVEGAFSVQTAETPPDAAECHKIESSDSGNINIPPVETNTKNAARAPAGPVDYTAYYRECCARLNDPAAVSYLTGRGISVETARAHWIGFDPEADPANAPGAADGVYKPHPVPRIITPTSAAHYVGRSIDPDTPKQYRKMNAKGSQPGIFNERALYDGEDPVVFVTEGVFDALSILEAGAAAIALNSTSNADAFLEQMKQRPTAATLVLAFDQDDAGQGSSMKKLCEGLSRMNINHIMGHICGDTGDPNDALVKDRAAFISAIKEDQRRAGAKPDNTSVYIDTLMGDDVARFRSAGDRKTGFSNLDAKAGGLYSGLYVIAATTSLGKTTWALQVADQLAEAGHDVIFFSLEQSRLELVSKSLSRITAQRDPTHAVTSLAIRGGYGDRSAVREAVAQYKAAVGDRLSIVEGNFSCDLSCIRDYVTQYIRRNGEDHRPVLFLDYLQILTPEKDANGRLPGTKEATDAAVTGLKRLSREKDLTVFTISSVNRANYLTPIDFEALKESGGIEYSADVIYGLQLQCVTDGAVKESSSIGDKRKVIREERTKTPRKIELVCLKNRYGISSFSCKFLYYPGNDLFEVDTRGEAQDQLASGKRK